jgi:hypothetical protein
VLSIHALKLYGRRYAMRTVATNNFYEEIARYAAEVVGTGDDLDESLEMAGMEILIVPDKRQ